VVLSRCWRSLLTALLLCWVSESWGANAYQTNFKAHYCQAGQTCNVYWPMDETAGTTLANVCGESCGAAIPSHYNMTTSGTPLLNQTGVNASRGKSVNFVSASTQYAEANSNGSGTGPGDISRNWTQGCWVKPAGIGADQTFFSTNNGTGTASDQGTWTDIVTSGGKLRFVIRNRIADGNFAYLTVDATTTMSNGTWYFLVVNFLTASQLAAVWVNGTQENSATPIPLQSTPDSIVYYDFGRQNRTNPIYFDGNLQDCFIVSSIIDITSLYCVGIGTCNQDDWPYTVKLDVPKFRSDGWMDKLFARGYVTGRFTGKALVPNIFGPYLPLAAMLPGNAK